MEQIIRLTDTELPRFARYEGNPNLKRAFIKSEYSEEQIEELVRCAKNPQYFAEHYAYILSADKGKVIVELRDYQKNLLNHIHENRHSCILSGRQSGKSTISAIYMTWYTIFHSSKKSVILANKEKISKEIFYKTKVLYENLPHWMQPGVKEWNATSFSLENGSDISCCSSSASAIRGITVSGICLCDEFAFLPINIADDFISSVFPTISSSEEAKIIMVSTPNGMNHFYNIWKKAEKGRNSFKPFKVHWRDVPGRDDNWLEQMKLDIGEVRVNSEYLCEFLGSSRTLINAKTLEAFDSESPISITPEGLHIYETPKAGHKYVLGVDVGKGVQGDNSVIQVLDLSVTPIQQVAVFGDNNLNPRKFGKYVVKVAKMYNNAFIMIENNAEGYAAAQTIWNEEEYDNLVDVDTGKKDIGIRATTKTKSRAVTTLKDMLEDNAVNIVDNNTIYELARFIETAPGRFQADDNEHDDYVTSLYWGLYITTLPQYYDQEDFTNIRTKTKEEDEEVYEEPLDVYSDEDFSDIAIFERELMRS